jgi:hypothetical protein
MIQIDLPVAVGVGSLMAHAAQQQIVSRKPGALKSVLTKVIGFHCIAFAWPPMYLLIYYFGFETSHMWWHHDTMWSYPWLPPSFFVALIAANIGGFFLGVRFVRAGHPGRALALFFATVAFATGFVLSMPDRTMTLGTYKDWAAGTAPPASSDPTFMTFVTVVMVGYTAGAWLVCRWLKREGAYLTSTSSVQ